MDRIKAISEKIELPYDEFLHYLNMYREGNRSVLDILIKSNEGLVISIVNNFSDSYFDKEDLHQEGLIALVRAFDTFDFNNGSRFSTFATSCIKNGIISYLRKNKRHLGNFSLEDEVYIRKDGSKITYLDKLRDCGVSVEDTCEETELVKSVGMLMNGLSYNEYNAIVLYFGLNGKQHLNREIAVILGVSVGRVSPIIKRALRKIRLNAVCNGFMEESYMKKVNHTKQKLKIG